MTKEEATEILVTTTVAVGQTYQHYRTKNMYIITDLGIDTETLVPTVAYRVTCEPTFTWFRPLAMFLDTVDGQPRFRRLGD